MRVSTRVWQRRMIGMAVGAVVCASGNVWAQTPQSPAGATPTPANPTAAPTTTTRPARPAARPWVNPQPNVPFLAKPATRPANWLVEHPPISPNASAEAKALLKFLYSISNKHTLTGQHNFPNESDASTMVAARVSGKQPVIYGIDWGFAKADDKDSAYVRDRQVQEIKQQWLKGSITAVTWHEVRPTEDEPVTFRGSVQGKLTDEEFEALITPGTPLNTRWCAHVDTIAKYMKDLEAAHVPILFRPYHEMNGNWFWWGGRRGDHGTKAMYRMMFDRMINHHKLTNLVWVWNVDQPSQPDRQFVDYFPGHEMVDVLSLDDYGPWTQSYYDDLNALSDGKVLAIGECGAAPTPDVFETQPKWTWYMIWAGMAGNRRRGATSGPSLTLADIVKTPRMLSLHDTAYWESVSGWRGALGLPAGGPPPPVPANIPTSQPTRGQS